MQDFKRWVKGALQRRNKKFYQSEGTADFRESVSRSIWPSKLVLSCNRILPARGILSFGGKVRLLLYVSAGRGKGYLFSKKFPSLAAFLNAAFAGGTFRLEQTRKQRSAFFERLSARGYGWLRRLRNEAWKK